MEKQVPGHRIQIDVTFLFFKNLLTGREVKRFQYTAIDDATRTRALCIYDRHAQQNAIDFVDKVRAKFPFRIHTIQIDNGHAFQSLLLGVTGRYRDGFGFEVLQVHLLITDAALWVDSSDDCIGECTEC